MRTLIGRWLATSALAGVTFLSPGRAQSASSPVLGATAITEVFGDGLRLTAVAVEFDEAIADRSLARDDFAVENRTVTQVHASTSTDPADEAASGRYVIVELDPEEAGAPLYVAQGRSVLRKPAVAKLTWTGSIATSSGRTLPSSGAAITTGAVKNLVVDEFTPLTFTDPATGLTLAYNLYKPRHYDPAKRYPLVLFMHDAGATSEIVQTTLIQGLGAVVWARPDEQAQRPCFVLAPQYSTQTVNDKSEASPLLDVTVRLVEKIAGDYSIDRNRLYTTGQSGGGMMSIAIDIKYPDLFAASLLVACQWDPSLVAPLRDDRLWIIVSEGDLKAYPGQNAIIAKLEQLGATVNRAVWNGRWSATEFDRAGRSLRAGDAAIHYVALKQGTVVPPGQNDDGGSNHVNTWRLAYDIEALRAWLFAQSK